MPKSKDQRRRLGMSIALAAVTVEVGSLWLQTGRLGGRVPVRCLEGHVFTTIWIPAASAKALRLGPWRVQRCPVGHHWSLVRPLRESSLTDEELHSAATHRDLPLP